MLVFFSFHLIFFKFKYKEKNVLGLNQVVEKNVSATNPSQYSMVIISSLDSFYSKEFCVQQLQQQKNTAVHLIQFSTVNLHYSSDFKAFIYCFYLRKLFTLLNFSIGLLAMSFSDD